MATEDDRDEHRRKRGRPRVAAPLGPVTVRLAPDDHDHVIKEAQRKEMSLSEYIRERLRRK